MFFFYFVANKLSLLGDQLDGFTYLVACHYCYITMILYVFFYFVANKLSLSLSLSLSRMLSQTPRVRFCGGEEVDRRRWRLTWTGALERRTTAE